MLKTNLSDGRTLTFDLEDAGQARRWGESEADESFQDLISAIGIVRLGVLNVLSLPKRFRRVRYKARLLVERDGKAKGEAVECQADDVLVSLVVYWGENGTPLTRLSLDKIGWRRFDRLSSGSVAR